PLPFPLFPYTTLFRSGFSRRSFHYGVRGTSVQLSFVGTVANQHSLVRIGFRNAFVVTIDREAHVLCDVLTIASQNVLRPFCAARAQSSRNRRSRRRSIRARSRRRH